MNHMNKSDLLEKLISKCDSNIHPKDIEHAMNLVLDSVCKYMSEDRRIEVRGFGSFCLNYRPERDGRNPRTGEGVAIPEKLVLHFKMGKELKERINNKS